MKSIIPLSAITLLAALVLTGCNRSDAPETPADHSTMHGTNAPMGRTNMNGLASTNAATANDATR